MILGSIPSWQPDDWQGALKKLITDPHKLAHYLQLSPEQQVSMDKAAHSFPLRLPEQFLQRLPTLDISSPVLKQFIPCSDEQLSTQGFSKDPVQETNQTPMPGLIHKYHGRVLLLVSSSCPVHCRYCFRRHFPYENNRNSREDWLKTIQYIQADPSLTEVILSGGDPLSAQDNQLDWLIDQLGNIPHLKRLRIHTRYPVILPQRITWELVQTLENTRLTAAMVIHCNHADELNPEVHTALDKLQQAKVTLLNQSVLLNGVNNQIDILIELSEKLYSYGVLPYYLHLLDRVKGASHFEIPESEALALYVQLQSKLPGYLVPKLVREEPGAPHKTQIG